jgi:eight-cysteine-cluster-containing protein
MRRSPRFALLVLAALPACLRAGEDRPATAPADKTPVQTLPAASRQERVRAVDRKDPLYSRVEGERFENRCRDDSQCKAGGCSGEVCSAAEGVLTTCEVRDWPQGKAGCGCVAGECVWYRAAPAAEDGGLREGQGKACREGRCPAGLKCAVHAAVSGAAGPPLDSCEIPCGDPGAVCPGGQECVTLADGPGRVCRPGR